MQVSSIAAIGVTLLIAGASEHAALSGNAGAYLQTIVNSADWIIQETPADSRDYQPSPEDSNKSTGTNTMTGSAVQARLRYLNMVGLALGAG